MARPPQQRSFALAATAHSSIHPPQSPLFHIHSPNDHAYRSQDDALASSSSSSSSLHPALAHAAATSQDGSLLARTVDGGWSVELSPLSLSTTAQPAIRLAFPAPLARAPTLHLSPAELVVVGLTTAGFLYRLVLPADWEARTRLLERTESDAGWATEYPVRALVGLGADAVGTVDAVDDECVLVGLKSGALLRLDWQGSSESWSETALKPSSYLSSLSSLMPFSSASPTTYHAPSIHSLAVRQADDGSGAGALVLALSADRRLRAWNVLGGQCTRTVDLPPGDILPFSAGEGGWVRLLGSAGGAASPAGLEVARRGAAAQHDAFVDYAVVYVPSQFLVFGLRPAPGRSSLSSSPDLVPCVAVPAPPSTGPASLRAFAVVPSASGARLWSAWDTHGRSTIFSCALGFSSSGGTVTPAEWSEATTTLEPAPTAAFFADRLAASPAPLAPATISSLFVDHLFHPARFALSSLSTALDGYLSTLLSSLGPSPAAGHPAALAHSYPSLPARIAATVGCHLSAEINDRTGAVKEAEHAEKLLAEWLGFLARVVEAERGARWALTGVVLPGSGGEDVGAWAVVRRDGLVVPFARSGPADDAFAAVSSSTDPADGDLLSLGHHVLSSLPFAALAAFRSDLTAYAASDPPAFGAVEDALVDLFAGRVEPALPADVLDAVDTAVGHLGPKGVARAARELLALVGQNDGEDAEDAEEEEDGVLSVLGASLLSSAVLQTVEARERFTLALVLALTAVVAQTAEDDGSFVPLANVLAEAVELWREVSAVEWVAKTGVEPAAGGAGEWVERFGGLKVGGAAGAGGGGQAALLPPPSVLSALLLVASPPLRSPSALSPATSSFLHSSTALSTPADRTRALQLVSRTLAVGQAERASALAGRWDEGQGMGFVKARAALALGHVDLAERLFERVAGVFDLPSDNAPLKAVLPAPVAGAWSQIEYYRHVSLLFAPQAHDASIIKFCNLAIAAADAPAAGAFAIAEVEEGMDVDSADADAADEDEDKENAGPRPAKAERTTKDLWSRLFAATISLGRYEDAYMVLIANPHRDTINDAVSHLITHMCHANQVARLVQFSFVGLQDVVERTLAFKARHSDPMAFPSYPMVLYSWHIHRGDYRSAALAIYGQARRFGEAHGPFADVSARRAKSYLLAINALALVDHKHAWLAMPVAVDPSGKRRKRTKTTANIPEALFSPAARARDVEIVDLDDIRQEYNLVLSTLTLAERFPNSFHSNILLAEDAVGLFLQAGMIDTAVSTAKKLHVDLEGLVPI